MTYNDMVIGAHGGNVNIDIEAYVNRTHVAMLLLCRYLRNIHPGNITT